jgi:hypothetical protein
MDIGNFLIEVEEIIICMKEFPHVLQIFYPFSISNEFSNQLLNSIQIKYTNSLILSLVFLQLIGTLKKTTCWLGLHVAPHYH